MKIVKLDRRFRYYPAFEQALRYNWREERNANRISEWLYQTYGASEYWDYNNPETRHVINDHWRIDKKKRRIYVKNQADISMALLLANE